MLILTRHSINYHFDFEEKAQEIKEDTVAVANAAAEKAKETVHDVQREFIDSLNKENNLFILFRESRRIET